MILSFIHHSQSDSILLHSLDEENGVKYIKLFLAKWRHSSWWNCVTIDEPCIDLSKLEPPPSKLYEIDENLQGDVSKYLVFHSLTLSIDQFDAQQKAMGLPTSDEIKKRELLSDFMKNVFFLIHCSSKLASRTRLLRGRILLIHSLSFYISSFQ